MSLNQKIKEKENIYSIVSSKKNDNNFVKKKEKNEKEREKLFFESGKTLN